MNLYILTFVNTAIEFDCEDAKPYFTIGAAQRAMENRIKVITENKNCSVVDKGTLYATLDCGGNRAYFNILTEEISIKEMAAQLLSDCIIDRYGDNIFGHDLLIKFLDEYTEEEIIRECIWGDVSDFFDCRIIGECLYQNALEKLGGKVDKGEDIAEYLNEDINFLNISHKYNDSKSGDDWMFGMCLICKGDDNILNEVRRSIDENREDKIFFDIEKASENFCFNHRLLSSKLTERQYNSICEQICGTPYVKTGLPTFHNIIEGVYREFYNSLYEIAKSRGINYILDNANGVVEVREDYPVNYNSDCIIPQLVIVGDAVETARVLDDLIN